jgi:hypothetical protein
MKTAENINFKSIPKSIPAEPEESWEERVFWKCDAFLKKISPVILIFFALYIIAHIISAAFL